MILPSTTAVAAWGVAVPQTLTSDALDNESFGSLVVECERHRILGLLGAAARAGDLPVSAKQRSVLDDRLQPWLAHALRAEGLLLQAADALGQANIPFRVLKGSALAHTVYPEPSERLFGDVDLLVRSDDVLRAVETLSDTIGARRAYPELRPGFDARFGKEILLRTPTSLELDLHRTLVEGALGLTVELTDLFDEARLFTLAGCQLPALAPPQQLLHACYSAILGDWPPRLSALRDVVQIVGMLDPQPEPVLALADRWRAKAIAARSLKLAWDTLRPERSHPLVAWAQSYRPTRYERMLLASHLGPARAYTRHFTAALVVRGPRAKLMHLRAVMFPQRAYLEARGLDSRGHARRAVRRLMHARTGDPT